MQNVMKNDVKSVRKFIEIASNYSNEKVNSTEIIRLAAKIIENMKGINQARTFEQWQEACKSAREMIDYENQELIDSIKQMNVLKINYN